MATPWFFSSQVLIITIITTMNLVEAQTTNTNTTSFSCSSNTSTTCKTYVIYQAQSPDLLDTGNISDLFGVSRSLIQRANNLSSEDATYLPGQRLLIPISCGCSGNQSVSNVSYLIKPGDNFYSVSISSFENFTDFTVVGEMNPSLVPTNLKVGQEVLFPLHCRCPTEADVDSGINQLLTYVWQRGDDVVTLSKQMNTSETAIQTFNNYRNFTAAVALPILIPVSQLPVFPPPIYYNTSSRSDVPGRKSEKLERTIVILSATLGVALALALWSLLVLAYFKYRHHWSKKALSLARTASSCLDTADLLHSNKNTSCGSSSSGQSKLLGVSTCLDNPVLHDIEAIMAATMNLDGEYRIDGSVYKATLNGEVFAVKRARGDVTEELTILQKLSHANLVKLRGVSAHKEDFFLVYEFAENTSLDRWLFPVKSSCSSNKFTFLSWKQRLSIALDIANGLHYIHSHTRPSIVHRDIRSSNILLNGSFKAKIANFSMAKPATVAVSPSIDVFAFGVVLLELLSGRRDAESSPGVLRKEMGIVMEVEEKREERLKKWMDPKLEGFYPVDGAMSIAAMAKACTSDKASERPSMSEMVFSLSVLTQSRSNDECERLWISNTEYKVVMTSPVAR